MEVTSWAEWKRTKADKIAHPVGFEEAFVDKVLSQISALNPTDVVPQYEFLDDSGKLRRIDFMIINIEKGYLLPIELDGRDKLRGYSRAAEHDIWNDFLTRQNALLRSFGIALRYSNLQMLNNPHAIVREISRQLALQAAQKSAADQQRHIIEKFEASSGAFHKPAPSSNAVKASDDQQTVSLKSGIDGNVSPEFAAPASQIKQSSSTSKTVSRIILAGTVLPGLAVLVYLFAEFGVRHDTAVYTQPVIHPPVAAPKNPPVAALENSPVAAPENPPVAAPANRPPSYGHSLSPSDGHIPASQAHAYIGQHKQVCGRVAGSREISSGLFINFDRPFPDDVMSAVIWRENLTRMGRLSLREGQILCISGMIRMFRSKPQIEVQHRDQITP